MSQVVTFRHNACRVYQQLTSNKSDSVQIWLKHFESLHVCVCFSSVCVNLSEFANMAYILMKHASMVHQGLFKDCHANY